MAGCCGMGNTGQGTASATVDAARKAAAAKNGGRPPGQQRRVVASNWKRPW